MTFLSRVLATLASMALFVSQTNCSRTLDPPPRPPPTMPALDEVPKEPESGMARVLISTDVPARVDRLTTGSASRGLRASYVRLDDLLCESTPCAVTLPYGDHEIAFTSLKDGTRHSSPIIVRVRKPTEVVNHTFGRSTSNPGQVLGGLAVLTGVVLVGVALGVQVHQQKTGERSTDVPANLAMGGGLSILGGGVLMAIFPGIHQEGSTTQWSPTIGGSFGGRF